jgi:hypothetical protein
MLLLSQASLGAPSSWECDGNISCHYGRICRGIFWPWSCQIPRNALLEHFLNNSFTFFTFLTSEKSYFYHRQKPVSKFRSYINLAQVFKAKIAKKAKIPSFFWQCTGHVMLLPAGTWRCWDTKKSSRATEKTPGTSTGIVKFRPRFTE